MKKSFHIIISAAAASFLVSTSFAQVSSNQVDASAAPPLSLSTNSGSAVAESTNVFHQEPAASEKNHNAYAEQAGTNAAPDANNPARSIRDRQNRTLTAGDQGNNPADVATTKAIRKELTSTKDMSTNAHNVKIITANGQVTLIGPVNSENEKRLIGEIASKVSQSTNVDNRLEVKLAPTGRK